MTKITPIREEEVTTSTEIVVAPSREVSLSRALHVGTHFTSSATMTSAEPASRRLTWLTGNNECFSANGRQALPAGRGWFIDQPDEDAGLLPDDYELMDAMELLCEQGLAAPCLVVHQDEQGKPRRVASWSLPVASLFVVCQGVPSKEEMKDYSTRWGVAYGWTPDRKSELHMQVFLKELMDAGYNGAFYVKFSTYCTDKALSCLKAHEYVLRFADALRADAGEAQGVAYYAYALRVQCSLQTITAGSQAGKTREIYYPIPVIPRLTKRNADDSIAFLDNVAITADQALVLEGNGRIERAVEWSVEKTKQILAGNEPVIDGMVSLDETEAPF